MRLPIIYLASQSPRRRELLKQIDVPYALFSDDANLYLDETPVPDELPDVYVRRLCIEKAQAGIEIMKSRQLSTLPVLAADTTVTLDGKIFGKPQNAEQAVTMLNALSGRTHQVITGVAVILANQIEVMLSTTTVRFSPLCADSIQSYVSSHEYADKAGGYAIQGRAAAFIEHISGSYSGVMGLPLYETAQLLRRFT
jgi:septum formation protein